MNKAKFAFVPSTSRQHAPCSSGSNVIVGTSLQIVAERLCEAVDLRAGSRVLDVAAGNGNTTLAAARRWCDVTSADKNPAVFETSRKRAEAECLKIQFVEADAENLPFPDRSYDVVLSAFGVMFAPDQEKAAAELMRVCKPGGSIGLASWTPDGFVGQLFRTIARYVTPSASVESSTLWGTESRLQELFAASAPSIRTTKRAFTLRYRTPKQWIDVFRRAYPPMKRTFAALDYQHQNSLISDLLDLMEHGNRSMDRTLVLPSEYLEVVIETGMES
jgi:ubiquinone/menaquinone biosynthesis C-methylase UbiE